MPVGVIGFFFGRKPQGIIQIAVVVAVGVKEFSAGLENPKPLPKSDFRRGQIPDGVTGKHRIKRPVRTMRLRNVGLLKANRQSERLRIGACFFKHSF